HGVYRTTNQTFYLQMGDGVHVIRFGDPGDLPVAGNWTGHAPGIGLFRPTTGQFFLLNTLASGSYATSDITVRMGDPGDLPITGDWTHSGVTRVGVYRPTTSTFYPAAANTSIGQALYALLYGNGSDSVNSSFGY